MNRIEALTEGLYLSLSAPTDEQSQRAAALCEHLAQGLTPAEVEKAKADAQFLYESGRDQ